LTLIHHPNAWSLKNNTMKQKESGSGFFPRNLMKGLIWLAVIPALFIFSTQNVWME
jgi:hypothetical protein